MAADAWRGGPGPGLHRTPTHARSSKPPRIPIAPLTLFDAALDEDKRLGSPFESARTLFARGRVLRRARRRRAAREPLERALSEFEGMGARLWAARVAKELERTAARRATNGDLRSSDVQIARLAAVGRTNREIAQALFVSTKTVEAALSRV
jgi:ATP/maltotriose-dependent transcriptional regulator MalT